MNIISLIKKDYLLMKRYLFLTMLFILGVPLLIMWKAPAAIGIGGFMMTEFMTFVICEQQLSVFDVKYPKALTLLFATPYKRSEYVIARYVFFSLLFVLAYVIYNAVCLFWGASCVGLNGALSTYLAWSIFLSIYLPLQFKLGYEKMKYAILVLIMFPSLVLPLLVPYFRNVTFNVSLFLQISKPVLYVLLFGRAVFVHAVSVNISIHILQNKEI